MSTALRTALQLALLLVCATSLRLRRACGDPTFCLFKRNGYYGTHPPPHMQQLVVLRNSAEPNRLSFLLDSVQKPFSGLRAKLMRQNSTAAAVVIPPAAVIIPNSANLTFAEEEQLVPKPVKKPSTGLFWGRIRDVAISAGQVSRRSLRRRLFNLWERQPMWALGVGREKDDQSLVSSPEFRRMRASIAPLPEVGGSPPGYFAGIGKALKSLIRQGNAEVPPAMTIVPYNDTAYGSSPLLSPDSSSSNNGGSSSNGSGLSLGAVLRAGGSWLADPFRVVLANVSVAIASPPLAGGEGDDTSPSFSLSGVTGLVTSFFRRESVHEVATMPSTELAAREPTEGDHRADESVRGMLSKSGSFIREIFPVTGQLVRWFSSAKSGVSGRPQLPKADAEAVPQEPRQPAIEPDRAFLHAWDASVALGRRVVSATMPIARVLLDRPFPAAPTSSANSSIGADPSLYFNINGDIAGKEDFLFMDREAVIAGISSLPTYFPKLRMQLSDGLDGIRRDGFSAISSAINDSSASAGQIIDYAAAIPASIPAYAYDTISSNARWLYSSMPNLQQMQQLPRTESLSGVTNAASAAPLAYSNGAPQQQAPQDSGYTRPAEFVASPATIDGRRTLLLPAKADFAFIGSRRMAAAVSAALAVYSAEDSRDFSRAIGLKPLLAAVTSSATSADLRNDAVKGLFRLLLQDSSVADALVDSAEFIEVLMDIVEGPVKTFRSPFRSSVERQREADEQFEAVRLLHRLVRCSDRAADVLKADARVRRVFGLLLQQADFAGSLLDSSSAEPLDGTQRGGDEGPSLLESTFNRLPSRLRSKADRQRFLSNATIIMEYPGLTVPTMSRVIAAALGGVLPWRPKQPGQKGLRILSFDGGGTRGVLSIAIMKELMSRIGKKYPHEVFDVICGTSTGGIIACLAGAQRRNVEEMELLYDALIEKIFGRKSNLKLVSEQALYDETELERVLYSISGDELFLDSNRVNCARTFCVSTKVNTIPQTQIWRNYNYPPGQQSRNPGAFRVNTLTAIRATTAAPTFFTPVQWEGGLYCDGALVANNPTVLALQEAKAIFPGIPIELVVSIGTGVFSNAKDGSIQSMGWDMLVNQIIASSTDTEDVHSVLNEFLSPDRYFRFNPTLPTNLAIDETDKVKIAGLKELGKSTVRAMDTGRDAKRMEALIRLLNNNNNNKW